MTLSFSSERVPGSLPPKPRPYHMTEPFQEHGIWCFWLTADLPVLQFVTHLNCVLNTQFMPPPIFARPQGRILVRINPRYDHHEAWLWLGEQLERESRRVELEGAWEAAILDACQQENDDSSLDDAEDDTF